MSDDTSTDSSYIIILLVTFIFVIRLIYPNWLERIIIYGLFRDNNNNNNNTPNNNARQQQQQQLIAKLKKEIDDIKKENETLKKENETIKKASDEMRKESIEIRGRYEVMMKNIMDEFQDIKKHNQVMIQTMAKENQELMEMITRKEKEYELKKKEAIEQQEKEENELAQTTRNALLDGWIEIVDPNSKKSYYYSEATKIVTWNRPTTTANDGFAQPASSAGWKEAEDPSTGETYYYNERLQLTTWDRPGRPLLPLVDNPPPPPPPPPNGTLPDGWVEMVEPSSGETYYYNGAQCKASWVCPNAKEEENGEEE